MNNIFRRIKLLVSNISELRREFNEIIRTNSDYLACGIYKVAPSLKMAYNKKYSKMFLNEDENCYTSVINRLRKKQKDGTTRLSHKLFTILYRYKKRSKSPSPIFSGDAILISTNNKTNRFIDAKKCLILAKYSSTTDYDKAIGNRNKWGKHFNTAPLLEINPYFHYTIEQYILKQNVDSENKLIFILDSYINAMPSLPKTKQSLCQDNLISLKTFCEHLHIQELYNRLFDLMKNDCSNFVLTHGDISFLNILYDGNKFCYIDLEEVNNRVFFYDFFYYIDNSVNVFMDYSLLDNYLQGYYDQKLSSFWQCMGLTFVPEDRFAYIFYFLYYRGIVSGDFLDYIYIKYKLK